MKTAVLFYSLEGNTKHISKIIAKELQADLIELKTKKTFPTSGIAKYFWGGKSVVMKEHPELANKPIHLDAYDNIIIGTPIWAGTYAAPFQTFLKQYKFTGKKVAVFACNAGGGGQKCFKMFKEALPDNQFVDEIDFVNPLKAKTKESAKKAMVWAKSLGF